MGRIVTWILRVVSALVIGTAGLGVGVVVANATSGADTPDVIAQVDDAGIYDCPAGARVVGYTPGTRVFVTARSDDGLWYQIRDLDVPSAPLWIQSTDLELDDPTTALPIRDCGSSNTAPAAGTTTTTATPETTTTTVPDTTTTSTPETTTTTVPDTTTTSTPETTTTTVPDTTTSSTKPPPTTTTTTQPDTTPPTISKASVAPKEIWENDTPSLSCPPENPREAVVTAVVTDDRAVASVVASWTIGGTPMTATMNPSGGTYTTTFGPFDSPTVTEEDPFFEPVTVTITARDDAGNTSSVTRGVTVNSVWECFI